MNRCTRMTAFLAIGIIVAFGFAVFPGTGQSQNVAAQQSNGQRSERADDVFMRRKLQLSQDALLGLVTEDFGLLKRAAEGLESMSRKAEWEVFTSEEYKQFSAEFRRTARSMTKLAEKKEIDGVSMAYVQLTLNCVECHKYTRGVRMAGTGRLPGVKLKQAEG